MARPERRRAQVTVRDRVGVAQIIAFEGLPPADLAELAALHSTSGPGEKSVALHQISGGNPLLALELFAVAAPAQPRRRGRWSHR